MLCSDVGGVMWVVRGMWEERGLGDMMKEKHIVFSWSGKLGFQFCQQLISEKAMAPVLLPGISHGWRSLVGCSPWGGKESDTTECLHFHFHALEKEMATHSSVLNLENPEDWGSLVCCRLWGCTELDMTEETQQQQCRRPWFDPWVGKFPWRRERLPTPVFLPGESQGRGNLVGCRLWGSCRVGHD